jgi:two-component system cell cycle sensor histidine kinase/response regulator CckA
LVVEIVADGPRPGPALNSVRARARRLAARLLAWMPAGGSLPDASWRDRHRAIVILLWLHALGIAIFGLAAGYDPLHSFAEGGGVAVAAALAGSNRLGRAARAGVATFGLVLSSAMLVHVSGGYVEFHFHFFVMVIVVSLYEDWVPFLLAVLWVVLEHGVVGVLMPTAVYNHPDAWAHPWKWAAIHGAFVVGASAASIAAWRLNETVRHRYHLILDSAGDGIYGLDRAGRITFANSAAARMLNRRPVEMVGRPEERVLQLIDAGDDATPGRAALRAAEACTGAGAALRRVDGVTLDIDFVSTPVRERGELVGAVVAFQDVTERRQAERALRESEERLRQSQKMDAIGQLAGGIAHDFNNLMTVVTGFSELMLNGLVPGTPSRRHVEQIAKAGARASALTGQLLAFSRQQVLEPELLDLNETVEHTHEMLGRMIGEDVERVTALAPALPPIRADRGQIGQVILNLVVNARDAMPRGGTLTVETRHEELAAPLADRDGAIPAGGYAVLEVSDTGIGMDDATRARIFEPFFTTKERGKGTGLGLATVYGIVAQSGGHIRVESAPGRGTTFRIYLPLARAIEEPFVGGSALAEDVVPVGHETILLVEDEEEVRLLVEEVLQASGYTVLAAAGAQSALRLANEYPGDVDMLLTDVVMPGQSGPELAQHLSLTRPDAVVLYMSGYTDHPAVHRAAASTSHAFLRKPFTPSALARAVRQRFDDTRGARRVSVGHAAAAR